MANLYYGNPYVQQIENSITQGNIPNYALTGINTGSGSTPNTSGLTTTTNSGIATLTNTTSIFNDLGTGTAITQYCYPTRLNQYINVYSHNTNGTGTTFNFQISGSNLPVGSYITIHIDSSCLSADTFIIQAGASPGPGNITATIGNTYTFVCFVQGVWVRM
jgi:hypothetical protein